MNFNAFRDATGVGKSGRLLSMCIVVPAEVGDGAA